MSEEAKSSSIGSMTIDITNLDEVLAMVEKIKTAAIEARAALASIGAPSLGECVVGELVRDEIPALMLVEQKRTNALLEQAVSYATCGHLPITT